MGAKDNMVRSGLFVSQADAIMGGVAGIDGSAVTQATNRTTGVTPLPVGRRSGMITTDTTSLAAEASADFVVTTTEVAIGDVVLVCIRSGAVGVSTIVSVSTVTAGTFTIRVTNNNPAGGVAETGAIIINWLILKATST